MNIIYSDADIAVIEKPFGLSSQKCEGENAVDILSAMLTVEVFPVHRLDKSTGGIMVYALNKNAAARLSVQITNNTFKKQYLAILEGIIQNKSDKLCDLLFFDRQRVKSFVVKRHRKGVKEAKLTYDILKASNNHSLALVTLITGRTHQIRVQFASRGYPVFGDKRYGSKIKSENIALWSHILSFRHPATNKPLNFKLEPPNWFYEIMK